MGFMGSLGQLFGFSKSKNMGDYQGEKPIRFTESPLYKPTFEGPGGVFQAMQRQGTSYDPNVMSAQRGAWADLARREFRDMSAAIGARGAAAGLGRSSLMPAQLGQAGEDLAARLGERSLAAQMANEENISQQQMQGRGYGVHGTQADVASQQAIANQQYNEFLRQQQFKEAQDAAQQAGVLRGLQSGLGFVGGGLVTDQATGALKGWDWSKALGGATTVPTTAKDAAAVNLGTDDLTALWKKLQSTMGGGTTVGTNMNATPGLGTLFTGGK